jgi:hypothetical protein
MCFVRGNGFVRACPVLLEPTCKFLNEPSGIGEKNIRPPKSCWMARGFQSLHHECLSAVVNKFTAAHLLTTIIDQCATFIVTSTKLSAN